MTVRLWFDPIQTMFEAVARVYPGVECVVHLDPYFSDENQGYGMTVFPDDEPAYIVVDSTLGLGDMLEVIAHELAHVVAGHAADHNHAWNSTWNAIHSEYKAMLDELGRA